jgi:hypothetical protein
VRIGRWNGVGMMGFGFWGDFICELRFRDIWMEVMVVYRD